MLSKSEAQTQAESFVKGTKAKSWTIFKDLYIFRVEWPFPGEEDWDPFLSVDSLTGDTKEFSIVHNITSGFITSEEFNTLKWADV